MADALVMVVVRLVLTMFFVSAKDALPVVPTVRGVCETAGRRDRRLTDVA